MFFHPTLGVAILGLLSLATTTCLAQKVVMGIAYSETHFKGESQNLFDECKNLEWKVMSARLVSLPKVDGKQSVASCQWYDAQECQGSILAKEDGTLIEVMPDNVSKKAKSVKCQWISK